MSEQKVTFCRICEASCGLIAEVDDGKVTGLSPDPEHPVSRGYACIKGTRYHELHHSPDRIKHPLKRVGTRWERISWDQAFQEIGQKARAIREKHGRHGLGLYMGNPAAFSVTHAAFISGFRSGLDTRQLYTAGSQDCSNKFKASLEMFGSPVVQPIPDFDHVRCFIIIGSNPAISQMSFVHAPRPIERLKAIEKAGGKVYFVNPRRTESAQQVGQQVFIRPDADAFFLLSFAYEVFRQKGLDATVQRHLDHVAELGELVRAWPAERTASVTGISAETVREMVTRYLASGAGVLYGSTGLNQGRHGTLAIWLVHAINAITGNLDRRGGSLVSPGLANVALLGRLSGTGYSKRRSRIGDHPAVLDALPAAVLADEILTPGKGQIRGMFVSAGNPVLSCPNGPRLDQAFAELELLVCIDLFRNESARHAHYMLPACSFLERPDIPLAVQGFQPTPYLQYTEAVVAPDGEQREEWWTLTRLCEAMGRPIFGSKPLHAYLKASACGQLPEALAFSPKKLYAALALASRQTHLGELLGHPHGKLLRPNPERSFLGHRTRVLTRNGKVDVAPAEFIAALPELTRDFENEQRVDVPLKLITKRERNSHNSWMHNLEPFVKPPKHTNYLYMNPGDAESRGLRDGDTAEIRTPTGRIAVPVKHSTDLMPGTVALPHGWGHAQAEGLSIAKRTAGVNANVIAADGPQAVEKLGGMSHLTGIVVEVARVAEKKTSVAPTAP